MADAHRPYYHPGHMPKRGPWHQAPDSSCPASLQQLLAVNSMVIDDSTNRDGNCGISAFTISIMDAMKSDNSKKKAATPEARRFGSLRRCPHGQRVAQARAAGVEWLSDNARAKLWEDMTVTKLVGHVCGENMSTYRERMRKNGGWVDTVFLHALACAYGVTVWVFQDGCDPAILGPHLHEDLEQDRAVVVPVALVNDYHFWAVVESRLPGLGCTPWARDKGEHLPFQPKATCAGEYSSAKKQPSREMEDDDQDQDSSRMPQPGLRSSAEVDKEMHFCVALSRWCPWSEPTSETVQAIQMMAQDSHVTDEPARCLARRRAMQALAYEEAHWHSLPDTMRYQRGARRHLMNPREWQRAVKAREVARTFMNVCSKLIGVEQLASQLELLSCARGVAGDHSQICPGIAYFTPAVIHNWRVLWYSLPSSTRQERLLKGFRASLEQHRQKELANGIEQWRMEYMF